MNESNSLGRVLDVGIKLKKSKQINAESLKRKIKCELATNYYY